MRRGGEQPEVNVQSAVKADLVSRRKLDSACCRGEPAGKRRNPRRTVREDTAHRRDATDGKLDAGKRQTSHRDGNGWLEAEWTEGATKEAGIPVQGRLLRLENNDGQRRTITKPSRPRWRVGHRGRYEKPAQAQETDAEQESEHP
jgi:hypothetical protein